MKKIIIGALLWSAASLVFAVNAEEIVRKLEANTIHDSVRVEGSMVIKDRFGTKESSYISWGEGEDNMLIEFTSLEERGQKILRTKDEIYLYFPDAEELIRLQGSALRDSVLGSDFSYEDMTGDKGILDTYKVTLEGTEKIDGHLCYRLNLKAVSRDVPYSREVMWVDTELFIYRQVHKFSVSDRLLKELKVLEIEEISGRLIPVRVLISDKMKKDSSTESVIKKIEIGIKLDPELFSLQELTW